MSERWFYHDATGDTVGADYKKITYAYDEAGRRVLHVAAGENTVTTYSIETVQTRQTGGSFASESFSVKRVYPHMYEETEGQSTVDRLAGPIVITIRDGEDKLTFRLTATPTDGSPADTDNDDLPDGDDAWSTLTVLSLVAYEYDNHNRLTVTRIHTDMTSVAGESGSQLQLTLKEGRYFETEMLAYDLQDNSLRVKDPRGVIAAVVYDGIGRPLSHWVGTDDDAQRTNPGNGDSDLMKVREVYYDDAFDGTGDPLPHATAVRRLNAGFELGDSPSWSGETVDYTEQRMTPFLKLANETIAVGEESPRSVPFRHSATIAQEGTWRQTTSDGVINGVSYIYAAGTWPPNLNESTRGALLAQTDSVRDGAGRMITQRTYKVSGGSAGSTVDTDYTYNTADLLETTTGPDGITRKTLYDSAGKITSLTLLDSSENSLEHTEYVYEASAIGTGRQKSTIMCIADGTSEETVSNIWYDTNHDGTGYGQHRITGTSLLQAGLATVAYMVAEYEYDSSGRRDTVITPDPDRTSATLVPFKTITSFNAAGRVTSVKQYASGGSDVLITQRDTEYGDLTFDATTEAFMTKSLVYSSSGTNGDRTEVAYDYDDLGRRCKATMSAGGYSKRDYDVQGTVMHTYVCSDEGLTSNVDDVAGDTVVEQMNFDYDGRRRLVLTTALLRADDDSSTTGLLQAPATKQFVYDAWNRLVTVTVSGTSSTTLIGYAYDGLNRRVQRASPITENATYDYYFNTKWQALEMDMTPSESSVFTYRQYVWCERYIDALLLQDSDSDEDGVAGDGDLGKSASGLDERLFFLQDANHNTCRIMADDGTTKVRSEFTPYGDIAGIAMAMDFDSGRASSPWPATSWT